MFSAGGSYDNASKINLTVYDSTISTLGDPNQASAIPEPRAYILTGCGLIAVGFARRRT